MSSRHIIYSLLLHLAAAGLLIVSFDIAPRPITLPPPADVVNAVTVDSKQVDAELGRLKDLEKQKREQELKRLKNLQDKAHQAERQRKAEEQRLAAVQKKKQAEEKQRVQEQQRLATLKKQQAEAEKHRKAEEEKQRQAEEARRKAEEEAKRLAEARRKAEEEQKRKAAEEALQKQLAEEQAQRDVEQKQKDKQLLGEYVAYIQDSIRREFNIVGLPSGLSCVLVIHTIPSGDVVGVEVEKSSGNPVFDRRAEIAVKKAAPLPVPDDPGTFERLQMREIRLTFQPES
jgi:colicin import membrane protein